MTTESTRRVFRARRKDARDGHRKRIALGLLSIRLHHGCLADLAAATGVSDARWKQWEDPDHPATISVADVATLAEARPQVAVDVVRLLTDPMGQVLSPRPDGPVDVRGWMVRLGRIGRVFGEAPASLAEALADGQLDVAELRGLRDIFGKAMELAAESLGEVDIALEERGKAVSLTSVPGGKAS